MARREEEPFIAKGDQVTIRRAGAISGIWRVAAARYASADPEDARIEMVINRGASMNVKTLYDPATMSVKSGAPLHMLSRDVRVGKAIDPLKRAGGRRP
jgi:hypothetical protein